MSKPEVIPTENKLLFFADLLAFQKDLDPVKKDGANGHFRSKYPTLNSVLDAVLPIAHKHNFIVLQPPDVANTQAGMKNVVITRLVHAPTGISEEARIMLGDCAPTMKGMQELGGSITYARRYGLISLCGLQDIDDDGETAVGRGKSTPTPAVKSKDKF